MCCCRRAGGAPGVVIRSGRVAEVVADPRDGDLPEGARAVRGLIAPGFVDLQVNGAFGADVGVDPPRSRRSARALPSTGVTAYLPTAISWPLDRYAGLFEAVERGRRGARRAHPRRAPRGPLPRAVAPRRPRPGEPAAGRPRRAARAAELRARAGHDARARAAGRARRDRADRRGGGGRERGPHRGDLRRGRARRRRRPDARDAPLQRDEPARGTGSRERPARCWRTSGCEPAHRRRHPRPSRRVRIAYAAKGADGHRARHRHDAGGGHARRHLRAQRPARQRRGRRGAARRRDARRRDGDDGRGAAARRRRSSASASRRRSGWRRARPPQALGLDRIGRIAPGAEADLVVLGPDGVVEETLVAGETVYRRES